MVRKDGEVALANDDTSLQTFQAVGGGGITCNPGTGSLGRPGPVRACRDWNLGGDELR